MDYIEAEKDFFSQFIIGGDEFIDEYLQRKRQDGVWGDDIEIQAMSEIYNRPIEIYAYHNEPMRTFHEDFLKGKSPIRLSYHGRKHYNSIEEISKIKKKGEEEKHSSSNNEPLQPGFMEETALRRCRQMKKHSKLNDEEESKINTDENIE